MEDALRPSMPTQFLILVSTIFLGSLSRVSTTVLMSTIDNPVKDCPVGYQLRIFVINVSTEPDRPKHAYGTISVCDSFNHPTTLRLVSAMLLVSTITSPYQYLHSAISINYQSLLSALVEVFGAQRRGSPAFDKQTCIQPKNAVRFHQRYPVRSRLL